VTRRRRAGPERGTLDIAASPRAIALELISGRGHYDRVIRAVLGAHTSVWIATANVKELLVEDGRAVPGRRRDLRKPSYVSVLAVLDQLAARGVELRLLHAEIPSRPFRAQLAQLPRLVAGGLALRRCPRVHMKAVIVDGEMLYLGKEFAKFGEQFIYDTMRFYSMSIGCQPVKYSICKRRIIYILIPFSYR